MNKHSFGEKQKEYSAKDGKELPVWVTPKYEVARQKAIEIIDSGKYGVTDADFWILMNATKTGKMAYTGLIISHNGCLKINDSLADKFKPECVNYDKQGYRESLVYSYCCPEQGLYEVGEVSAKNCKNEYPYAMAYKRLFDRVVLKLSKLAYSGIMSDSESDEFTQQLEDTRPGYPEGGNLDDPPKVHVCRDCQQLIEDSKTRGGDLWSANDIAIYSERRYGRKLCPTCMKVAEAYRESEE